MAYTSHACFLQLVVRRSFAVYFLGFLRDIGGSTEIAGRENDGPSKLQWVKMQDMKMQDTKTQNMKMQDMKMTDRVARHEIAGHENYGPSSKA